MTANQVRAALRKEVKNFGGQTELARVIPCSQAYISDILRGTREPAGKLLNWLGIRRVVTYKRLPQSPLVSQIRAETQR